MKNKGKEFSRLVKIMDRLRGPEGCPWDHRQTKKTLKVYLIDEAYEVMEAIEKGSSPELKEELGDLLFQILFLSKISEEKGEFTIDDVIASISEKMIRRHPHVFGSSQVEDADDVKRNWAKIKEMEGKVTKSSALSGVSPSLPALYRADRLSRKASKAGFDWPDVHEVLKKVEEEWKELKEAIWSKDQRGIDEEYGDMLFVLVSLARFLSVDPEAALRRTNERFIRRFQFMEDYLKERGKNTQSISVGELEELWERAKELV